MLDKQKYESGEVDSFGEGGTTPVYNDWTWPTAYGERGSMTGGHYPRMPNLTYNYGYPDLGREPFSEILNTRVIPKTRKTILNFGHKFKNKTDDYGGAFWEEWLALADYKRRGWTTGGWAGSNYDNGMIGWSHGWNRDGVISSQAGYHPQEQSPEEIHGKWEDIDWHEVAKNL